MKSLFVVLLCAAAAHAAAPPKKINYQGRLVDPATGSPRNGSFSMTFKIYDAPTGGTALFTESQTVPVNNGVFSVQLGSSSELSADLFARTSAYLGVTVASDSEMTPRQQLVMSPYAFVAAGLMRGKDIFIYAGASVSTFTVDGHLQLPGLDQYYDSTADSYRISVNNRAATTFGTSSLTLWNSDATAAATNQGLNLPAALTEMSSAVQGTRMTVDCDDLPAQLALRYNIRAVTAATLTLTVSVRDVTNTSNVLVTASQAVSAIGTYLGQAAYAGKPAWCAGTKQVALYTSGGNGTADYIFSSVQLLGKP